MLLATESVDANTIDWLGRTSLHLAVETETEHGDVAALLMQHKGIVVNAPLSLAVGNAHHKLVALLKACMHK